MIFCSAAADWRRFIPLGSGLQSGSVGKVMQWACETAAGQRGHRGQNFQIPPSLHELSFLSASAIWLQTTESRYSVQIYSQRALFSNELFNLTAFHKSCTATSDCGSYWWVGVCRSWRSWTHLAVTGETAVVDYLKFSFYISDCCSQQSKCNWCIKKKFILSCWALSMLPQRVNQ